LKLQRAASLDHSEPLGAGMWQGMVWVARPSAEASPQPTAKEFQEPDGS
jgi:hypothetical protein